MNTKARGIEGENIAARFLEASGYEILARNYRSRFGEIDIIALRDSFVIFCEVKRWSSLGMDSIEHAVGREKRRRIIETAKIFLDRNRQYNCMHIRFDVILIGRDPADIDHLESAFMERL